ncbi:hypothetical protein [Xanthobacter sediminis]
MSKARNPRTAGRAGDCRTESLNRPPEGSQWFWITVDMASSPAWRALPWQAMRVVLRVLIEHANHAGRENGRLIVPYGSFESYGIRRMAVREAISQAEALGFLDVLPGTMSVGRARAPSLYRLTWLATHDGETPTNRWKAIHTDDEAAAVIAKVGEGRVRRAGPRTRDASEPSGPLPRSIKQ